jgi:peptide chain release factor subunit 3
MGVDLTIFSFLTGMVDKRTMEKYEQEAKELGRESWYLSWALDLNQEERDKVCFSS